MNLLDSQYALPRVELKVHFQTGHHGQRRLRGGKNEKQSTGNREDLPRLTRLLALAHRWNHLIEEGAVANYSEIARLMGLSRARVTQIMDMLYLAPKIQEEILLPPNGEKSELTVPDRIMRPITRIPEWNDQRALWRRLFRSIAGKNENADINKIDAIARPLNKPA